MAKRHLFRSQSRDKNKMAKPNHDRATCTTKNLQCKNDEPKILQAISSCTSMSIHEQNYYCNLTGHMPRHQQAKDKQKQKEYAQPKDDHPLVLDSPISS